MCRISQLFIYPVKSLGGIAVDAAPLTERGLQYDRRWMLVDTDNRFLTQREYPAMSLLLTAIEHDYLVVYPHHQSNDRLRVPLEPAPAETISVKVWDDECQAQFISDRADAWFSEKLSTPCRLMYMPGTTRRMVDQRYAHAGEITSFSDGYPLLMIGQASLDDLNSRLAEEIPINRFRPNIVFTGGYPYEEDSMAHVVVNGLDLYGVKPCARCMVTTIDQSNGAKGKEPLKTLAAYRTAGKKIYFGQNMLCRQKGYLQIGDTIETITRAAPIVFAV